MRAEDLRGLRGGGGQAEVLNNYAMLVHSVHGDLNKAEALYKQALQVSPHPPRAPVRCFSLLRQASLSTVPPLPPPPRLPVVKTEPTHCGAVCGVTIERSSSDAELVDPSAGAFAQEKTAAACGDVRVPKVTVYNEHGDSPVCLVEFDDVECSVHGKEGHCIPEADREEMEVRAIQHAINTIMAGHEKSRSKRRAEKENSFGVALQLCD